MRILLFVHRYWPSVGGVEKYIQELAKALIALGHDVRVVAGAHIGGLPESDVHEGIRVDRFPAQRSPIRCRAWFWRNRRCFTNADVVHVSNTHMLEYLRRMAGPVIPRRKLFLTRHGMSYVYPVPETEIRRAKRSREWVSGVVHDGAFIEKWLGVPADLCPDQGLSPVADEIEPIPEPPPNSAVFIGRLEPDSGIRIYFDGVRRLVQEHHRSFELRVYGDGSLMPRLRDEVERDGLPVRFFGRVLDAQRHIVDSCFAFIDGRMAMQEAMARRRLVLPAYVDPLKRDYVGTEPFSPYLIPVASGEELARRVAFYADHPAERAVTVERAFAFAQTLNWEKTATAYLQFWGERLANPRSETPWLTRVKRAWRLSREARVPVA